MAPLPPTLHAHAEDLFADSLPPGLEMVRLLGSGSHGSVAAVRWSHSTGKKKKKLFALKKVSAVLESPVIALRTIREIRLLSHFQHPNVLTIHAAALHGSDAFLRLPLLEMDLGRLLKQEVLEDFLITKIFHQVMCGVLCLHTANVLHRDLKPGNVLVSADGIVKIADLGLARSMDLPEGLGEEEPELTEYVVTRWYRAPEVALTAARYTWAVDIWSAGCILGEMVTGNPLFKGSDPLNQLECIIAQLGDLGPEDVDWIRKPSAAWTFVERVCKQKCARAEDLPPFQRLRKQLEIDKDVRDIDPAVADLLVELLRFNPQARIPAAACLQHSYLSDASPDDGFAMRAALEAVAPDWSFDHRLCYDSQGNVRPFSQRRFKAALEEACEEASLGARDVSREGRGRSLRAAEQSRSHRAAEQRFAGNCTGGDERRCAEPELRPRSQSSCYGSVIGVPIAAVSRARRGASRLRRFLVKE
eukprot:TRINITY_DN28868_c0_g1_i1.p1 TRINITY_DN28868_c0_g1~~TRINITY_DN28868_c0_g1_i1.p1  ORF type:complete len:474 (+),score=100.67 TRINITY_DN28868_c0_g1_i1:35-1456(+)